MENPLITLANDSHQDKHVVSLIFEKDFGVIGELLPRHRNSKRVGIYPVVIHYPIRQELGNPVFFGGVSTSVSMRNLKNIKTHRMDSNYNTAKGLHICGMLLDMMGKLLYIRSYATI